MKTLHILTGPPGSGKTTYAANWLGGLPVYDTDLGNKKEWVNSTSVESVLMTSAPTAGNKQYWIDLAKQSQFTPVLRTIWVERQVAHRRMRDRPHHNQLTKDVERWYRLYTRHPEEQRHESEDQEYQGRAAVPNSG